MFRKITATIPLVCILTISLTQCYSSTVIDTVPPGATLYIDGEIMGETPYTYTDSKIVGSAIEVLIKKPGYKDFRKVITKDEEVSVGAIIGGVFCLFPFLWMFRYKKLHRYELER